METTYTLIKAARSDGKSFYNNGEVDYRSNVGNWIEVFDADPNPTSQCGKGIHASPSAHEACVASRGLDGSNMRPWSFFLLVIDASDVIYPGIVNGEDCFRADIGKWRCRRALVAAELSHEEVFGSSVEDRIAAMKSEIATWKTIPWLKPSRLITDEEITDLVSIWRERLVPYMRNGAVLPGGVRVVRRRADAVAATADAAAAYDYAANAAAADAADADADDAAADATNKLFKRLRWYIRPYYILRRNGWWILGGLPEYASPNKPLIDLLKLGCVPIGFVKGEFVVYCPEFSAK